MIEFWSTPPFSPTPVLPDTPSGGVRDLYVRACPGEVTALSLCVRSSRAHRLEFRLPQTCPCCQPSVQVRYVLPWMQYRFESKPPFVELTPELLVNDTELVQVVDGKNVLKEPFRDSLALQPIVIQPDVTRQLWLTIRVPEDAEPGRHTTDIAVWRDGVEAMRVPVVVDVLPFILSRSPMTYGVYYTHKFREKGHDAYLADMRCIVDHGITTPLFQEDLIVALDQDKMENVAAALAARAEVGIDNSTLFCTSIGATYTKDVEQYREPLCRRITKFFEWAKPHGVRWLAVGGRDEGNAAGIEAQLPLWRAALDLGCDLFVSAGPNEDALWDSANNLVSYPLLNALGFDQSLDRWQSYGAEAWHTGPSRPENPDYQRRRYGLKAYHHGFAGVCPFAWQFAYGSPLDDTDSPEKDQVYAYPDADGKPIETIQLAALRQAVNDTAYAARADVKPDPGDRDLDELRWELILKILEKV